MLRPPELAAVAAAQGGVFTRRQLRALGISGKVERARLTDGRWARVLGPAYVAGPFPVRLEQRAWAGHLLTGGVVSHRTAAALQGLLDDDAAEPVHVRLPLVGAGAVAGVRQHRVPLSDDDCTDRGGLPITTVPVTLLDCLTSLPYPDALALARDAVFRRWVDPEWLSERASSRYRTHGAPQLRRILADLRAPGRSGLERRLHALLRRSRISGWTVNVVLSDPRGVIGEVDVLFAAQRVVIEVDGYGVHAQRSVFQRDRAKQNRLIAAGYTVLRFTGEDLSQRADHVIRTITAVLRTSSALSGAY